MKKIVTISQESQDRFSNIARKIEPKGRLEIFQYKGKSKMAWVFPSDRKIDHDGLQCMAADILLAGKIGAIFDSEEQTFPCSMLTERRYNNMLDDIKRVDEYERREFISFIKFVIGVILITALFSVLMWSLGSRPW